MVRWFCQRLVNTLKKLAAQPIRFIYQFQDILAQKLFYWMGKNMLCLLRLLGRRFSKKGLKNYFSNQLKL